MLLSPVYRLQIHWLDGASIFSLYFVQQKLMAILVQILLWFSEDGFIHKLKHWKPNFQFNLHT